MPPNVRFKAKMHQNRFALGSTPDAVGGVYSPRPLAIFKGLFRGRREGTGEGMSPIGEPGSASAVVGRRARRGTCGGDPGTSFLNFTH